MMTDDTTFVLWAGWAGRIGLYILAGIGLAVTVYYAAKAGAWIGDRLDDLEQAWMGGDEWIDPPPAAATPATIDDGEVVTREGRR